MSIWGTVSLLLADLHRYTEAHQVVAEAVVKEKLKDEQQKQEAEGEGEGEGQSQTSSDDAIPEVHVEKSNILLLGPTGSGVSQMCWRWCVDDVGTTVGACMISSTVNWIRWHFLSKAYT